MRKRPDQSAPEREAWRGAPLAARFKFLKTLWIAAHAHSAVVMAVTEKVRYMHLTGECEGLLVICGSGGGKTSLCRELKRQHPDDITDERTLRRMIIMRIPKICTRSRLARELLFGLGDSAWNIGTAEDNLARATALILACGVEILAVDNFQDIPERRSTGSVRIVGNWFRDLFDSTALVFLALGTEQAKKVRFSNDQVRRRVVTQIHIPYFSVATDKELKEWMFVLRELDRNLPMAEDPRLRNPQTAALLYFACNGIFDYLCKLVKRAMMIAVERGSETIANCDLEKAFPFVAGDVAELGNPFEAHFKGRALDRADELFHRMENCIVKDEDEEVASDQGSAK